MLQHEDDQLIRDSDSDVISCTITDVTPKCVATVEYEEFKHARFDTSIIVIYRFEEQYYYPLALEFRLIDNNILYLIEELGMMSMEEIFTLLSSSMEKEEHWTNKFELVVVHLSRQPRYSIRLPNGFSIQGVTHRHVYDEFSPTHTER